MDAKNEVYKQSDMCGIINILKSLNKCVNLAIMAFPLDFNPKSSDPITWF